MRGRIIIFSVFITTIFFSCNKFNSQDFTYKITKNNDESFEKFFLDKYSSALNDSLYRHEQLSSWYSDFSNEVHVQSVLYNNEKDSVYIIAVSEAIFEKDIWSQKIEKDITGTCSFYTLVGIPITFIENKISFNLDKINVYDEETNCKGKKGSMEKVVKNYPKSILEALKKTQEMEFPDDNGVVFLKVLYSNYYKDYE